MFLSFVFAELIGGGKSIDKKVLVDKCTLSDIVVKYEDETKSRGGWIITSQGLKLMSQKTRPQQKVTSQKTKLRNPG